MAKKHIYTPVPDKPWHENDQRNGLGKIKQKQIQGFRKKTVCESQPILLGTRCKSNPTIDPLQRALAASTVCVHVMRHALPMI